MPLGLTGDFKDIAPGCAIICYIELHFGRVPSFLLLILMIIIIVIMMIMIIIIIMIIPFPSQFFVLRISSYFSDKKIKHKWYTLPYLTYPKSTHYNRLMLFSFHIHITVSELQVIINIFSNLTSLPTFQLRFTLFISVFVLFCVASLSCVAFEVLRL